MLGFNSHAQVLDNIGFRVSFMHFDYQRICQLYGGYTELLVESRRQAVERMLAQAEQLGANAVTNVRFATSSITQGAAELYAYGTAVVAEPLGD